MMISMCQVREIKRISLRRITLKSKRIRFQLGWSSLKTFSMKESKSLDQFEMSRILRANHQKIFTNGLKIIFRERNERTRQRLTFMHRMRIQSEHLRIWSHYHKYFKFVHDLLIQLITEMRMESLIRREISLKLLITKS